jgi:tetratricopeptide (TPR) repeat protein
VLSRFHGRAQELAELSARLTEGRRLLGVWGPMGAGKTRLLWELAASLQPGGAAGDAQPPQEPALRVGDLEATRLDGAAGQALFVFDAADRQLAGLGRALPELARRHPGAAFVVTTRRRPALDGLHALHLAGLPTGADGHAPAVALFLERCAATGIAPAGEALDIARLAALTERLDGLPLFVERAAALVPALGIDGVERLAADPRSLMAVAPAPEGARSGAALAKEIRDDIRALPRAIAAAFAAVRCFQGAFASDDLASVLSLPPPDAAAMAVSLFDAGLLAGHAPPSAQARLRPWRMFAAGPGQAPPARLLSAVEARVLERGAAASAAFLEDGHTGAIEELRARRPDLLAVARRALTGRPRGADAQRAAAALVALDALLLTQGPSAAPLELVDLAVHHAEATRLAPEPLARLLALRARAHALREGSAAIADLGRALALLEASPASSRALLATLRIDLGVAHHHRRELDAAAALYTAALAGVGGGHGRLEARALGNLAAVDHDRGETGLAAAGYERAVAIAAAVGETRLEAIHSAHLALIEQENGAARSALARFDRAAELLDRLGDRRLLAITLGNLGMLHFEEGRLALSRECQRRALGELAGLDDPHSTALAQARLAATLSLMDEVDEARAWQERSARAGLSGDERARQALFRLVDGFIALALARRAALDARDEDLATWLARAEGSAREVATLRGAGAGALVEEWDDLRTLLRVLQRNLDATAAGGTTAGEALLVTPEARWFRPPRGQWHDLRQRSAARRILERLCARQLDEPGEGLRVDELRDAGWPGERILASAAKNRVYVVLNQLRGLGLRRWLVRKGEGWALDPRLGVHRVAQEPVLGATREREEEP